MKTPLHNNLFAISVACLTLGLAPYFPEPHIWGKLRWIAGGAVGMGMMDWFDTLMHGAPWLLLLRVLALNAKRWAHRRGATEA